MKRLLFCFLKIVASSKPEIAQIGSKKLLFLLRKIPYIFNSFDPNPELMQQLNFDRLITGDKEFDESIFDLMVFVNRYYSGVVHRDFCSNGDKGFLEKFRKEEMMRMWKAFDFIAKKVEKLQKKFGFRGVGLFLELIFFFFI